MKEVGERLARIEEWAENFKEYESRHWHKLNNDLQPLVELPERMAREIGKMHGLFEAKLNAASKELERSMGVAIAEAMKPRDEDVKELQVKVSALEQAKFKLTGAKMLAIFILQTIIAAISAFAGMLTMGGRH